MNFNKERNNFNNKQKQLEKPAKRFGAENKKAEPDNLHDIWVIAYCLRT